MNNKHTTSLVLKSVLAIFVICSGFYCYRANNVAHYDSNTARQERVAINQNNAQKNKMTKKTAINQFVAHKPNLAVVEKEANIRASKAINLACNHLHNHKEVAKNVPTIKAFLGKNAGSTLANDTKVTTTAQGKPMQQSVKLLGKQISFGKYHSSTNTLPMNILIKYKTSPVVNGSGNTSGIKPTVSTYYEAFHINIKAQNTYNIAFNLEGHARSQSGQNS